MLNKDKAAAATSRQKCVKIANVPLIILFYGQFTLNNIFLNQQM